MQRSGLTAEVVLLLHLGRETVSREGLWSLKSANFCISDMKPGKTFRKSTAAVLALDFLGGKIGV